MTRFALGLFGLGLTFWLGCPSGPTDSDDAGTSASPDASVPDAGRAHCDVTAPTACPTPAPTYADVAPTFTEHCAPCHQGTPGGPWPLKSYEHISDWRDTVGSNLLDCSMPPADAGTVMTVEERLEVLTWIRCGLPR